MDSFTYLRFTLTKDGSSTKENRRRLTLTTSAMTKLNIIWWSDSISFCIKMKLFRSLLISILLYRSQSWTRIADTECWIQAFEYKCYRKLLHISYRDHKKNVYVRQHIKTYTGSYEPLCTSVKHYMAWHGHISHPNTLSKIIPQGTMEGNDTKADRRNPGLITSKTGLVTVSLSLYAWLKTDSYGDLWLILLVLAVVCFKECSSQIVIWIANDIAIRKAFILNSFWIF